MQDSTKSVGERAQNVVIGELAKWGIGVAIPLSDNWRFDLIAVTDKSLKRIQVKSSSRSNSENSVLFSLVSTNGYNHLTHKYGEFDCDVYACFDLKTHNCYLLLQSDVNKNVSFVIRTGKALNNQKKTCHLHDDYVISEKRIEEVFGVKRSYGFPVVDMKKWNDPSKMKYEVTCSSCHKLFNAVSPKRLYCTPKCCSNAKRKCERPSKETISTMLSTMSMVSVGKHFGVSDNAVRKWLRSYALEKS